MYSFAFFKFFFFERKAFAIQMNIAREYDVAVNVGHL